MPRLNEAQDRVRPGAYSRVEFLKGASLGPYSEM